MTYAIYTREKWVKAIILLLLITTIMLGSMFCPYLEAYQVAEAATSLTNAGIVGTVLLMMGVVASNLQDSTTALLEYAATLGSNAVDQLNDFFTSVRQDGMIKAAQLATVLWIFKAWMTGEVINIMNTPSAGGIYSTTLQNGKPLNIYQGSGADFSNNIIPASRISPTLLSLTDSWSYTYTWFNTLQKVSLVVGMQNYGDGDNAYIYKVFSSATKNSFSFNWSYSPTSQGQQYTLPSSAGLETYYYVYRDRFSTDINSYGYNQSWSSSSTTMYSSHGLDIFFLKGSVPISFVLDSVLYSWDGYSLSINNSAVPSVPAQDLYTPALDSAIDTVVSPDVSFLGQDAVYEGADVINPGNIAALDEASIGAIADAVAAGNAITWEKILEQIGAIPYDTVTGEIIGGIHTGNTILDGIRSIAQAILDAILALPLAIANALKALIIELFVPDGVAIADTFNGFKDMMQLKLGIIWDVPELIVDFFQGVLTATHSNQDTITLPEMNLPFYDGSVLHLWDEYTFEVIPSQLSFLRDLCYTFTSFILVLGMFNGLIELKDAFFNVKRGIYNDELNAKRMEYYETGIRRNKRR